MSETNKLRVFECFAGYGGWSFALKRLGVEHETVGYSEVDKFAIQCYEQNHDGKSLGDITTLDLNKIPDFDLLVASPPCQAFSIAGKGLGADDSRGRLFENTIEIMRVKQPKYAIYENVKGLLSKKHTEYFNQIIRLMNDAGYNVFHKVLNTKEHGIPQNRERVFIVCIRKDIDSSTFQFPEKQELKIFLKDILEEEVDDKYYLKPERVEKLLTSTFTQEKALLQKTNTCGALLARDYKDPKCVEIRAYITPDRLNKRQNGRRFKEDGEPMFTLNCQDRHGIMQVNNPNHSNDRVYDQQGISPTLNTMQGGDRQPFIVDDTQGFDGVGTFKESPTLRAGKSGLKVCDAVTIRKLTPLECFRLQGFRPGEINLDGLSNSQQYKLAGNGVTIDVCEKILRGLLK